MNHTQREHRRGNVVEVTNYHQRSEAKDEPTPGYQGGYHKSSDNKGGSR